MTKIKRPLLIASITLEFMALGFGALFNPAEGAVLNNHVVNPAINPELVGLIDNLPVAAVLIYRAESQLTRASGQARLAGHVCSNPETPARRAGANDAREESRERHRWMLDYASGVLIGAWPAAYFRGPDAHEWF